MLQALEVPAGPVATGAGTVAPAGAVQVAAHHACRLPPVLGLAIPLLPLRTSPALSPLEGSSAPDQGPWVLIGGFGRLRRLMWLLLRTALK